MKSLASFWVTVIEDVATVPPGPLMVTWPAVKLAGSMASSKATARLEMSVGTMPDGATELTVGGVVSGRSRKLSLTPPPSGLPARSATVGASCRVKVPPLTSGLAKSTVYVVPEPRTCAGWTEPLMPGPLTRTDAALIVEASRLLLKVSVRANSGPCSVPDPPTSAGGRVSMATVIWAATALPPVGVKVALG